MPQYIKSSTGKSLQVYFQLHESYRLQITTSVVEKHVNYETSLKDKYYNSQQPTNITFFGKLIMHIYKAINIYPKHHILLIFNFFQNKMIG